MFAASVVLTVKLTVVDSEMIVLSALWERAIWNPAGCTSMKLSDVCDAPSAVRAMIQMCVTVSLASVIPK